MNLTPPHNFEPRSEPCQPRSRRKSRPASQRSPKPLSITSAGGSGSARSRSAYTALVHRTNRENFTGSIRNTAGAVKTTRSKSGCERQNANKPLRSEPFSEPCYMRSVITWTIRTSTFGNPTILRGSFSASPASFTASCLHRQKRRRRLGSRPAHYPLWCKNSSQVRDLLSRNNSNP